LLFPLPVCPPFTIMVRFRYLFFPTVPHNTNLESRSVGRYSYMVFHLALLSFYIKGYDASAGCNSNTADNPITTCHIKYSVYLFIYSNSWTDILI
jgi:hypothetical protein